MCKFREIFGFAAQLFRELLSLPLVLGEANQTVRPARDTRGGELMTTPVPQLVVT